jgi:DNA-binding response OmpR family regulator
MKNILIVDDDPLILRMYQRKLTDDGYTVDTAVDGEIALASVKKKKPNLILLDIMMPKKNGTETLKDLKADSSTKSIPVIILTNLGDSPKDVENAKKLGALNYLVKADTSLKDLSDIIAKTTA